MIYHALWTLFESFWYKVGFQKPKGKKTWEIKIERGRGAPTAPRLDPQLLNWNLIGLYTRVYRFTQRNKLSCSTQQLSMLQSNWQKYRGERKIFYQKLARRGRRYQCCEDQVWSWPFLVLVLIFVLSYVRNLCNFYFLCLVWISASLVSIPTLEGTPCKLHNL